MYSDDQGLIELFVFVFAIVLIQVCYGCRASSLCLKTDLSCLSTPEFRLASDIYAFQDASFEIAHVEVWGLGPPVDADEEREKVRPRQPNLQIRGGDVDEDDLLSQLM